MSRAVCFPDRLAVCAVRAGVDGIKPQMSGVGHCPPFQVAVSGIECQRNIPAAALGSFMYRTVCPVEYFRRFAGASAEEPSGKPGTESDSRRAPFRRYVDGKRFTAMTQFPMLRHSAYSIRRHGKVGYNPNHMSEHRAECGATDRRDPARPCGYSRAFTSERAATRQLLSHLKHDHGADLDEPSSVIFGWVKPEPPPPPLSRRRGKRGGDRLGI